MAEISQARALSLRMTSLLLRGRHHGMDQPADVAAVVNRLGAMQAQDLASGLWSFGVRLPEHTLGDVTAALERREAIRTWPMRGTVHFVPPRDAHWMLDLMGSRALAGTAKRREFLGLTEEVADRAMDVLGTALAGDRLTSVTVDGVEMYLEPALLDTVPSLMDDSEILVLPGFDEYLLGYKDRSFMLADEHKSAITPGNNGIFQATVVNVNPLLEEALASLRKAARSLDA